MGLDIHYCKDGEWGDFSDDVNVSYGYLSHFNFRTALLSASYPEYVSSFNKVFSLTSEEEKMLYNLCNEDSGLASFVFHSDCDGSFTPEQCSDVYRAFERINECLLSSPWRDYFRRWKAAFKYCYENSSSLMFS